MQDMGENGPAGPHMDIDHWWSRRSVLVRTGFTLLMGVGLLGVSFLAYVEHQRDLQILRHRLAVVADERVAAVGAWMARNETEAHLGPERAVDLMALLQPPISGWASERTMLIQAQDNGIRILSSMADNRVVPDPGSGRRSLAEVEADALTMPGQMHDGLDHSGRRVMAVSRPLQGVPWVLVHAVNRVEALAASTVRWRTVVGVLTVGLVIVGVALVTAWRLGSSERARRASDQHRRTAERYRALSTFMDAVLNAQPNPVLVGEAGSRITFVNRSAADLIGLEREDIVGRPATSVLGTEKGTAFEAIARAVVETGETRVDTLVFADEDGAEQVWRTHAQPLDRSSEQTDRVLTTVEDLSILVRERRRRERNTDQLIDTLVGLVDERDPDSANQSRHVALMARIIAERMGLPTSLVETAHQAARLVNIGKIRVPRALLTKKGPLAKEEMADVRAAMDSGAEILKDIEFDGPVLETLRQINEWVDGSGRPLGLTGDQILPTAQATALANSFVALISPRAFRPGLTLEEVERALEADSGRRFDRRAVTALQDALRDPGACALWSFVGRSA